jgi:hypothetical protein
VGEARHNETGRHHSSSLALYLVSHCRRRELLDSERGECIIGCMSMMTASESTINDSMGHRNAYQDQKMSESTAQVESKQNTYASYLPRHLLVTERGIQLDNVSSLISIGRTSTYYTGSTSSKPGYFNKLSPARPKLVWKTSTMSPGRSARPPSSGSYTYTYQHLPHSLFTRVTYLAL